MKRNSNPSASVTKTIKARPPTQQMAAADGQDGGKVRRCKPEVDFSSRAAGRFDIVARNANYMNSN